MIKYTPVGAINGRKKYPNSGSQAASKKIIFPIISAKYQPKHYYDRIPVSAAPNIFFNGIHLKLPGPGA